MSDAAHNPENYCYRHPDRQSFVLCQRCTRTICPECQTQMPVGVICPECLKAQQRQAKESHRASRIPRTQRGAARVAAMSADSRPLMTWWIVGVTLAVYLLQLVPVLGGQLQTSLLMFAPYLYPELTGHFEPWRLLTVLVVHASIWHVLLNMLAVWMLGQSLEPLLGHLRFLWLYLLAGLGGSVAIALFGFDTPVVGASGAIFGLFVALLIIGRHIGANVTGIAVVLAFNLVLTFVGMNGTIAWQAHVGGLAVGALVGWIYIRTRGIRQQRAQKALLIGVAVVLLALLAVPAALHG